jgi:hypothetical protein
MIETETKVSIIPPFQPQENYVSIIHSHYPFFNKKNRLIFSLKLTIFLRLSYQKEENFVRTIGASSHEFCVGASL